MSRVVGSTRQVADAAYIYVTARQATKDADRVSPQMTTLVDAALHDLTLCCGYPCDCETGTCEGLILSVTCICRFGYDEAYRDPECRFPHIERP